MKKLLLILALATVSQAAPNPNAVKQHFVIVDYVPHPPLTKSTLWLYIRWFHLL